MQYQSNFNVIKITVAILPKMVVNYCGIGFETFIYKTFYNDNLLPFHAITVILYYKTISLQQLP